MNALNALPEHDKAAALLRRLAQRVGRIWERYALALILLVALALSSFHLGGNGLWLDEFNSLQDALDLPAQINPVRPLYYLVLRLWMFLGTSEVWLRGLSVIFGLGSVWLLYRLGEALAGAGVGRVAALMLACSPLWLNHVQEVRMYTLGNFLTLAGSWLLVRSRQSPYPKTIAAWALMRLLSILTIPLSILLLLPDGLIVLGVFHQKRQVLRRFVLAALVMAGGCVPSAVVMLTSAAPQYFSDWTADLEQPGLVSVVSKLTSFTVFWPLASLPHSPVIRGFYLGVTALLGTLFALGVWQLRRQPGLRWAAAWALLPAGVMMGVSLALSPIWNGRYLLFVAPYVLILLAAGFVWLGHRYWRLALVLALVYGLALGGGWQQYYGHWQRDGWREVGALLQAEVKAGDAIAVYAPLEDPLLAVTYYYQGEAPVYPIGPFKGSLSEQEVDRVLSELPQDEARLWIVFRHFNGNPKANRLVKAAINNQYPVELEKKFAGPISVSLVRPRSF